MPCQCSEIASMKQHSISKIKVTVYLSRLVVDRLNLACKDPTKNKSKLTEKALNTLLDSERDLSHDAAIIRKFDSLGRQVAIIDRHQHVVLESLGLFLRYYLTVTPPLPKAEQEPARAIGHQRFEFFIGQLAKRLAGSQTLVSEVMEKVSAHDPDLFMRDIDERAFVSPTTSSSSHAGAGRGGEAPAQQGQGTASRPPEVASGPSSPSRSSDAPGSNNG
jgi:hypothetical protein